MKILKFVGLFSLVLFVLSVFLASRYYFLVPRLQQDVAILVLGKGGEGHTGSDLTDTIMVGYLNSSLNKINILSLPRDIWIPEIRAKLNAAYYYGGFKMAGDSVTSITGLPINYTIVVDFSLFKDLIDGMDGINVDVSNSFVDEKYPIEGKENDLCDGDKTFKCRYETIEFIQGKQKMNGELALKFVRSRNAIGEEGTDLAREKRQQKIISAIKTKILSRDVILNPSVLKKLYQIAMSYLETDVDKEMLYSLAKFTLESKNNITFLSIPEDMLTISQNNKRYDKQYVFIPPNGSWKEFQQWITNQVQLPTVLPKN